MESATIRILRVDDHDPVFPELGDGRPIHHSNSIDFVFIENGTSGNQPSVAMKSDMPDGSAAVIETTLAVFIAALAAARGAFPESFARGPFAEGQ